MGLLGQRVNGYVVLLGVTKVPLHRLCSFAFPPVMYCESACFPIALQRECIVRLLNFCQAEGQRNGVSVYFSYELSLTFFKSVRAMYMAGVDGCTYLFHFSLGFLVFFLLLLRNIRNISSLFVMCITNTFS